MQAETFGGFRQPWGMENETADPESASTRALEIKAETEASRKALKDERTPLTGQKQKAKQTWSWPAVGVAVVFIALAAVLFSQLFAWEDAHSHPYQAPRCMDNSAW